MEQVVSEYDATLAELFGKITTEMVQMPGNDLVYCSPSCSCVAIVMWDGRKDYGYLDHYAPFGGCEEASGLHDVLSWYKHLINLIDSDEKWKIFASEVRAALNEWLFEDGEITLEQALEGLPPAWQRAARREM